MRGVYRDAINREEKRKLNDYYTPVSITEDYKEYIDEHDVIITEPEILNTFIGNVLYDTKS